MFRIWTCLTPSTASSPTQVIIISGLVQWFSNFTALWDYPRVLWRPTWPFRTITYRRCPFRYKGLECKVGSQEIPGVTAKYGHGVQNEARQRLIEFCQENTQTPSSNNTREDSTCGHHPMVSTEIRLIIFFAAKDGDALYCQQKQDQELTVAQIMNSLLPNSDLNGRK